MTDLRHFLPAVRDQGQRGTCLTIAVNDGHHAARRDGPSLSVDFLHFHAARLDETSINEGVSVSGIREALADEGHPAEDECRYSMQMRSEDWSPPTPTRDIWKRTTASPPPTWGAIHSTLAAGRPAVLVLSITDDFYEPPNGIIASTDGTSRASHAVLAVGLHASEDLILVRNSWGDEWALDGYAWVSPLYIQARCVALITFGDTAT